MIGQKLVIGISGTIASGKGTVAKLLKEKGLHLITLSDILRDELKIRNLDATRKNLQDVGNELRKTYGGNVLVQRAYDKFKSYETPLIVDGLRNLDEINYLKSVSKFYLIGVDAPFDVRWARVKARNRDSDLLNYDRFVIDDARDRGFNEPLTGQQVGMCLVHADFLINNDETFTGRIEDSKLYKEVTDVYRKITKKP